METRSSSCKAQGWQNTGELLTLVKNCGLLFTSQSSPWHTCSDNAALSDPHTAAEREEFPFDCCHLLLVQSIYHTDTGVVANPGKLVTRGWEWHTVHPTTYTAITVSEYTLFFDYEIKQKYIVQNTASKLYWCYNWDLELKSESLETPILAKV